MGSHEIGIFVLYTPIVKVTIKHYIAESDGVGVVCFTDTHDIKKKK